QASRLLPPHRERTRAHRSLPRQGSWNPRDQGQDQPRGPEQAGSGGHRDRVTVIRARRTPASPSQIRRGAQVPGPIRAPSLSMSKMMPDDVRKGQIDVTLDEKTFKERARAMIRTGQ